MSKESLDIIKNKYKITSARSAIIWIYLKHI
jgi:hypothetical protein